MFLRKMETPGVAHLCTPAPSLVPVIVTRVLTGWTRGAPWPVPEAQLKVRRPYLGHLQAADESIHHRGLRSAFSVMIAEASAFRVSEPAPAVPVC